MIAVSVIMPVYNVENLLNKSISSIQSQTLNNIEIICVDDGSEDNSLEVLEELQDKYGNIKIISQDNSGPGIARNVGIDNANGEYIAFLDSDDIFLNNQALEKMYEVAHDSDANLVAANLRRINQDYTLDQHYDFIDSRFTYFTKYDTLKSEDYGIPFAFYKNIFKRSFLLEHNITFPDLRFGEDPVFMVDVLANIDQFFCVPLDLYGYNHSIGGGVNEKITTFEKKNAYILHFRNIFDILKKNNLNSIFLKYKNEFIDYLIYSNNLNDEEINEIVCDVFKDYKNYFSQEDYGFFIMDYIVNKIPDNSLSSENNSDHAFGEFSSSENSSDYDLKEFNLIKEYLFKESSITSNNIDLITLKEYFKYNDDNGINLNNDLIKKSSFSQLLKFNNQVFETQEHLEEEVESLENAINKPFYDKNAEFLRKFLESRIDIKNFGNEDNSIEIIECDDSTVDITHPNWFNDEKGLGTIINAVNGCLNFKIKCIQDGNLNIGFKGIDYKDKKGNRIPIYIDYTCLKINGEKIIDESRVSWHDNPFIFTKEVEDGEIVDVQVKWAPFTEESNIYLMPKYEKVLNNFYKARIDVKNSGDENNKLILVDADDPASNIYEPQWLDDENGVGSVVYSTKGEINVSFKCVNDGNLEINFKSFDFRDKNNKKVPIFIDYTEIEVNGKNIHRGSFVSWHDNSFDYTQKVKDGEIISFKAKWRPLTRESNLNLLFDSENSLNKFSTSRIDIKNYGNEDNDIKLLKSNDYLLRLSNPKWFVDKRGKGSILTSLRNDLKFSFKCINDGNLEIGFRSIDFRDKHNRKLPIYLDYTDILVDGENVIDGSTVLWHDNQLFYKKEVQNGQIVDVEVKWRSLNKDSDCKNIFDYRENNVLEIEDLKKELNKLKSENKELKSIKDEILSSNSWKFTEPLRKLKN